MSHDATLLMTEFVTHDVQRLLLVEAINDQLQSLGVQPEQLVYEQ